MSFINDLEDVVEIVSDWAVEKIQEVIGAITDDTGTPFGELPATPAEKLDNYLKLRGNPMAWSQYIDGKVKDMVNELVQNGVPEADIATIKPLEIVLGHVFQWSVQMEQELASKFPQ